MKRDVSSEAAPLFRFVAHLAMAGAFLVAGAAPSRAQDDAAVTTDPAPPVILPLPAPPTKSDDALTVDAQVSGRGDVARAVLWVKGEMDRVYRAIPMRSLANGTFRATLDAWPSRGRQVRYYVEAWNAAGKSHAGDASTPFVAEVFSPATVKSLGSGPGAWWKIGIVSGLVAFFQLRAIARRVRGARRPAPVESSKRRSRLAYVAGDPE